MSDSITVAQHVLDQYNRVNAGEKASKVAHELGITGSTVSANVKRIRDALAAGKTVNVEGGTVTPTTPDVPTIDPHAIAEGMATDASIVTRDLERIEQEAGKLRTDAEAILKRAQEQHAMKVASADALTSAAMPRLERVAKALEFDIDEWRAAVAKAEQDAADKAKADAEKAKDAAPVTA